MDEVTHTQAPSEPSGPLVLGTRVDAIEFDDAVDRVSAWAAQIGPDAASPTPSAAEEEWLRRSGDRSVARIVCAANVHMVMEAWDDARYRDVVNSADLVLPDGQPLVWALRLMGVPQRNRVRVSPDMLMRLFAQGERQGWSLGLYGGTDETLPVFKALLTERFPGLQAGFAFAPPFRPLTPDEDEDVVGRIRSVGVQLLLVGLGCPKQEYWMAQHKERLSCVMMGVGAAFDLFGGRTKEAPHWTRDIGLEWAWRLCQEPRRLWRRHAKHDPRFITLMAWQAATAVRKRQLASRS